MSATKTQAFVLKTKPYRDTSLLAYFYTKDFGKINGIVKGIRDTRARFGGMLEPFSLNEILFYRKRRGGDLSRRVRFLPLCFDGRFRLRNQRGMSFFEHFTRRCRNDDRRHQ